MKPLLVSVLAILFAACGGQSGGRGSAPERPLARLADPNAAALSGVSLASLRSGESVGLLDALVTTAADAAGGDRGQRIAFYGRIDRTLGYALREGSDETRLAGATLFRGRFEEGDLEQLVPAGCGGSAHDVGGGVVRIDCDRSSIVAIGDHTLALGNTAEVDAILARQDNPASGELADETLQAMAAEFGVGTTDFALVADLSPFISRLGDDVPDIVARALRHVAIRVQVTDRVQLVAELRVGSPLYAAGVITAYRAFGERLLGSIAGERARSAVSDFLERARLDREGSTIRISYDGELQTWTDAAEESDAGFLP